MALNDRTMQSLKAPTKKRYALIWDHQLPGFGARVTAAGVKSFILSYRNAGRRKRYTIGRYPEFSVQAARIEAEKLRGDIRKGADPLESKHKERTESTVADLITRYLEHVAAHKRASGVRNDTSMLNNIILPRLGKHRVKAIGKGDMERIHNSMRATPFRANRVLAVCSAMWTKAKDWEMVEKSWENPCKGINKFHEPKRTDFFTIDTLKALEKACAAYPDQNAANAIRVIMFTGCRPDEAMGAQWEQFDLRRGVWTKPSHTTKEKKTEHIPLNEVSMALLASMKPKSHGPLFPGANGNSRVTLRRPWVQICKSAGLATPEVRPGKRRHEVTRWKPTIRLYGLRHTFISLLVSSGVSLYVAGKLAGHSNPSTTQRYAHLQDGALRAGANAFPALKG
jgi:integrase